MEPTNPKTITLTGSDLKTHDVAVLAYNHEATVQIADSIKPILQKSRKFLENKVKEKIVYGVNTGFGPMASHIISDSQLTHLQENLIRSHAVGIGASLDKKYVLAAMVVRLNTLIRGYSGISLELAEHLQKFINHRITPVIPEHGAVGTSGDLTQLAHIALALMGEGEVMYKDERRPTKQVLQELHIQPYTLKSKEGIALINGTSMMTGIAALVSHEAHQLLSIAVRTTALSLELVHAFDDGISKKLHDLRPHPGQVTVAAMLRDILSSSQMLQQRNGLLHPHEKNGDVTKIPEVVQEIYSLRCSPQILGPVLDTLRKTTREVEIEMNSVSDNPIVDWENDLFLHGGNFHGDYIATALDHLKMTLVKLTLLSDRRTNFFLNSQLNRFFPPFLNLKTPGLTLGLQGLQFVSTSTAAQSQSLAFPHSIHSIPTNADNQDIVSMGTDAAYFTTKVISNAYVVLTIELLTLAQAVDFLGEKEKLSNESKRVFGQVRSIFPAIQDDRTLVHELPQLVDFLKRDPGLKLSFPQ